MKVVKKEEAKEKKKQKPTAADSKRCNAGYSVEWSRDNVQGKRSEQCVQVWRCIPTQTVEAAIKAAEKWLAELGA